VRPAPCHLAGYVDALKRGWSADNIRGAAATREALEAIAAGAGAFLDRQHNREGKGPPVVLPDGSTVPRLPGFIYWMWDGEFCGSIGFRWQRGTVELPPHVLGHIGYAVVPWKRRRGYATAALGAMLTHVWAEGLPYVELTSDLTNVTSHHVIERNGGRVVERFFKPPQYGGGESLRFRIMREEAGKRAA
jgi:predicted acetyltransferase